MNGILLIDKPAGWTSHDVVAKLRGILREKRIGHSGTLDPMATGLLVVFVGRATRAVEFAEADQKRYLAGLRLGQETNTQDTTGTVLREQPVTVTRQEIEAILPRFRGVQQQIPPMYSAIKCKGQKLYDIARKGGVVERKPREITIHELRLLDGENADWSLEVCCSKGTYIRTLCHDMGQALGCGGCMSALRRTEAGTFSVEDAYSLEEIQQLADAGSREFLRPVDSLFAALPAVTIPEKEVRRAKNGNLLRMSAPETPCRVYGPDGEFLLLGRGSPEGIVTIKSFFAV